MKKAFLYIDILGFSKLVMTNQKKVNNIFSVLDQFRAHRHFALHTIVFSDTILVFNNDESRSTDYYCTYLVEYAQELFYKLSLINVYFKAILTYGDFKFTQMTNIDAYYGEALIDAYCSEKKIEGFGLFVDKKISSEIIVFDKVYFDEKYDFVFLCQSFVNLYSATKGNLPTETSLLIETDDCYRIDEDLRFFREIEYIIKFHPLEKTRVKYQKVYNIYKANFPSFFETFEEQGFLPFTINPDYTGSLNPFIITAEQENSRVGKGESHP